MAMQADAEATAWPAGREILYIVDVPRTLATQSLIVEVACRDPKAAGGWTRLRFPQIRHHELAALPEAADRRILTLLAAAEDPYGGYYGAAAAVRSHSRLPAPIQEPLLREMCETGRCRLRTAADDGEPSPLAWDGGEAWQFRIAVRHDAASRHYVAAGILQRGQERIDAGDPLLVLAGGLLIDGARVARLDDGGAFAWVVELRTRRELRVREAEVGSLIERVLGLPRVPPLDLPAELRYEEVATPPRPRLTVAAGPRAWGPERLRGRLGFDYGGRVIDAHAPGGGVFDATARRLFVRDAGAEREAGVRLARLGFKPRSYYSGIAPSHALDLPAHKLPRVVAALLAEGWHVEADGKLYRHAGAVRIDVTSDIDWFELRGTVEFGETSAPLPRLLAALKRGERTVRLGDGSFGVLPEEWLQRYGALADLGQREDDHLRFTRTQVGVLDALLAALPDAATDAVFARARDELARFEGVEPLDPSAGFTGTLRGYQREGLGWLAFLQRFGFGGCLADDMGLGKTVQVLALLEARREQAAGPSLVVVPKSLVFNWMQEAARFTPALRVLDHTGTDRARDGDTFGGYDVVLTTYGTLRRDAVHLKDREFDYVILDEAQAIKNADTESAKAARLLRGRHRLALSGTPIENHLGELWSLFEFLNPGMLGSASAFGLSGAGGRTVDEPARALLARALRPFVLRRTKAQVAQDLPRKLEQTLYCELDGAQRVLYDELREHYRRALLGRIAREGLGRSKIQILEALLRLRQAACHPALIDRGRAAEGSAKLDMLLPRLAEVADEGHKALVFSQFTSLLALVRARLDRDGIPYEYLDGRTRDRAARVTRFQADPGCRLFLVSLKAGGLGLNLTAAEYVFLLDPWWNPAVEAQAIDRTHRIGQTRPVFAYRLIARGTVEEKVLELQQTKRDLADAIINADSSLLRTLTRDDLELLLS